MTTIRIRALRSATALVAAAALALGGAAAAQAAPTIPTDGDTATLNIHKHEQSTPASTTPGNGLPTTVATPPVAGVTFTVAQVDPAAYDLTTNAGWLALDDLTVAGAQAAAKGATATIVTDAAGLAVATDLPVGVYLVTETAWPAGVTPSAPFLVTLPLTHPTDTNDWLYTVHVYPKNAVTRAGKTVADASATQLGDAVSWTITGDIPEAVIDAYRVTDTLDAKLTYVDATVAVVNPAVALVAADYTLTHDAATNTVTVDFTAAGLAKLNVPANQASQVQVTVNTTVNAIGEIANEAMIFPNRGSITTNTPIVTPPVITKFGAVTVLKTNNATPAVNLAGAQFSIYASATDAEFGENPIELDGATVFTTAADGTVTLSGLRYSGWANGVAVTEGQPGFQAYWLVEVKAPAGYELLADAVKVVVTGTDTVVDYTVVNVPANGGFELPLTGGTISTALFYAAGGVIILAVVLLIVRSRRRENTDAS